MEHIDFSVFSMSIIISGKRRVSIQLVATDYQLEPILLWRPGFALAVGTQKLLGPDAIKYKWCMHVWPYLSLFSCQPTVCK